MEEKKLRELEVGQFARRLRRMVDEHGDFRIVWFLGAGCSVSSGIPTAAGLVRDWMPILKQELTGAKEDWEEWAGRRFPAFVDDPATVYGDAIEALFPSERERQRAIEHFGPNVVRARRAGHPDVDLVADLARVIADDAPVEVLDRHPAWKALAGA